MENFPPNSHISKQVRPTNDDPKKTEPRVVEKVAVGEVVRRKKPLSKRFVETFFGGDAKGVLGYIVTDVILPAARETVADVFSQGIERILFGEARSTSRRTGVRPGGSNGYVNYGRYATQGGGRREEPRNVSRRARASHDFDEIILATRGEAEEVVDRLFDLVAKFDSASVADLYDLVGVTGNYTDNKWGWKDVRGAGVTRVNSGYLLDLPKPEELD